MSVGAWVLVWVILVLASAGVFVLIAVHLWGKARTVLAQLSTTGEVFGEFAAAVDALERPAASFVPALKASDIEREQWRHGRRVNLVRRAKRKAQRRNLTFARWKDMTFPPA